MSLPAHTIEPVPQERPAPTSPARRGPKLPAENPRPSRQVEPSPPAAARPRRRRARRRFHLGFAIFAGAVLTVLIVGVVALNVLLAQSQFRITGMQSEVNQLSDGYVGLTNEAAQLSSPSRIAGWAQAQGMIPDSNPVILRVSGTRARTGSPSGTSGDLSAQALALKGFLGDGR